MPVDGGSLDKAPQLTHKRSGADHHEERKEHVMDVMNDAYSGEIPEGYRWCEHCNGYGSS